MSNHETKPLTGNKGEWSEIYVLFRLLGDGKIYAADEDLNRMENTFLSIIKIIREENEGECYEYFTGKEIRILANGKEVVSIPAVAFTKNADFLIAYLRDKEISKRKGAFPLEQIEVFMNQSMVHKIKAPSAALNQKFGGKADITMEVQEPSSGVQNEMAFSIKSEVSSPATLVNSSEATNFVFQVHGITDEQMEACNAIKTGKKIQRRIRYLKDIGASISYVRPYREQCEVNLQILDRDMPEIMAKGIYDYYWEGIKEFKAFLAKLVEENPCRYPRPKVFYEKRLKDFLYACFAGLNLGKDWNGSNDVSGGYIIVKEDGEVLAYHTYIQDAFRQFLLDHCKFDKGSTTKHNYGYIYKENGSYYIRLNLQIRFC